MPPEPPPEQPPIDPRLRARMIAVRREAGRRRLKVGGLVAVAVGVLVLIGVLLRMPIVTVGNVDVTGAVYTDPAVVNDVVRALKGSSMLTVDTSAARRKLAASPWVRRVRVTKDWPRSVHIDIAERAPVAGYLANDGRYRVVDDEGYVVAALDGIATGYPRIVPVGRATGGGAPVAAGQQAPKGITDAARVVQILPDELRAKVTEVGLNEADELELHLSTPTTVVLGTADDLQNKLVSVLALLHQVDPATIQVLDVRAPSKPVCQGPCKSLTGATP
jgi:cell division protein FtsQ